MDKPEVTGNGDSDEHEMSLPSERLAIDFDRPDSMVGRNLDGRFLIEKNLTEAGGDTGGIGVVYLARDTKLMGKDVVVKILNENALKHPDIIRKFQHEKEALIRLDHPGIVRILDSGTLKDGNPFMVMDYIKGHSLRKALLAADRLPLEVAANIIEAITDALSAAHSAKILHRDIKPENIMLTPLDEGLYRVRLIDFGIARVEESKLAPATEISRAIGSVLYIAPEQLIGQLDLTPAADIYATAIVAYEMLTGETPFKPKAIAEMYQMEKDGVQTLPSALRPDMPREAERILLSALEFDPLKRPQNARAFGRYLAHELRIDGNESDRFFASVHTEFSKSPTQVMPAVDPTDFVTVQRPATAETKSDRFPFLKWAIPGGIILAILAAAAVFVAWNATRSTIDPPTANANLATRPSHELSYFLMVQKMIDGKPREEPFKSSGQEIFESGYKFTLNFQTDAEGYMYIYSEDKDAQGKVFYNLLFPTPSINNGLSQVPGGRPIETFQSTFQNEPGTEVVWMLWTKEKREDLEAVMRSAIPPAGKLKPIADGENLATLQDFIDKNRAEKRDPPIKDSANKRTVIKAYTDIVVHRFELEHR